MNKVVDQAGTGGRLLNAARDRFTILVALVAICSILLVWAAVIGQTRFERNEAVDAAVRANANRAVAFEQYVIRTLESVEAALVHISNEYGTGGGNPADPRLIADPSLHLDELAAVSVVNAQGYLVAASKGPFRPYFNVSGQEAFSVHVNRAIDEPFISPPLVSKLLNRPVINITRRITRPDGGFGGVAAVSIEPRRLIDFYRDVRMSQHDLISVIGEDGITRARRTGERISFGEDLTGRYVMEFHRRYPNGTYLGPSALDGIPRFFSHRTLEDYPLFVTVGVTRESVLAPLRERHAYYYAGAGILTALILAFAFLLISYTRRRRRAELEIAEKVERLRQAQRIARIGDWEYDLRSGAIIWSDQLYAMYERDPAEGPPTLEQVLAYFDEPGRAAAERAITTALETGEPQEYERRVILPSGAITFNHTAVIPLKDKDGKVVRLHGTDQDISARKLIDMLQAKVGHLSRIDAMNTMAATLAHEINQPLTAAANYLAGTKRLVEQSDEAMQPMLREGLDSAEKQLLLAGKIIRRTRDMISDRSRRFETVRLTGVVDDALSLLAMASAYPDVRVKLEMDPAADLVRADPVQIQQVLINLIRNACEAMAGRVLPELVVSAEEAEKKEVRVCVADNGAGISKSVGDLFSTFSTSKESGLGIGLSISRTIVESHGGQIWVERTGPEGTALCFTLRKADQ